MIEVLMETKIIFIDLAQQRLETSVAYQLNKLIFSLPVHSVEKSKK